jgi:type IV pilus assembly protein PilW
VQETGRLALEHLQQALQQAGHLPWETCPRTPRQPGKDCGLDDSRQAELLDPAAGMFGSSSGDGVNHVTC